MDFEEVYPFACSNAIIAASTGNAAAVQALIAQGKPTNSADNRGWRALHHAAHQKELECLQILLRAKDVDVNAQAFEGGTALTLACRGEGSTQSQTEIVKCLLKAKTNPNLPNNTPWKLTLNEAIETNNIDVLKLLIKYRVDVNATDGCYGTPLFAAIQKGCLEAVILLLSKKAKTGKQGPYNLTPLHCLFVYGKHELNLLKLLISHQKIQRSLNERDIRGATPLALACMSRWTEAVSVLLNKRADPNIKTHEGCLPLFHASEEFDDEDVLDGESAFCQLAKSTRLGDLLSNESECGEKSFWSLFHMLLRKNKLLMLKYFLKMDMKPDSFALPIEVIPYSAIPFWDQLCSSKYLSPLAYVCFLCDNEEKINLAHLLIQEGSSVNCATPQHLPPIVTLSSQSRPLRDRPSSECLLMQLLIENGANVLYRVKETDPLPAAYLLSYHTKEHSILWYLLYNCVPASAIFTSDSFASLQKFYEDFPNTYSETFILKRLSIVNKFVSLLPQNVWNVFNLPRDILPSDFKRSIESPKTLLHLSAIAIRGFLWNAHKTYLVQSIERLCTDLSMPNAIKDILLLRQERIGC